MCINGFKFYRINEKYFHLYFGLFKCLYWIIWLSDKTDGKSRFPVIILIMVIIIKLYYIC